MGPSVRRRGVWHVAFLLSLIMAALVVLSPPTPASAQESSGIVRVGWYDSKFNITDELGRRSGYAYDYQQEIAAHTGWKYEYVEGSWAELLQMLRDGKIDLLSDVSRTEERAEHMLFSGLPMGTEEYYLFAAPGNDQISSEDLSTFNGKKIGAQKGSVQIDYCRKWAQENGIEVQIVELTGSEKDNLDKLSHGEIDLYLSLDGFFDKGEAVPVCMIGTSDYYFAVSKSRPELLAELNNAMSRIQDENHYYNQQLYAKYLQTSSVNNFLNAGEKAWLAEHGSIRVGYQDNYLAFCAKDPVTGELTGALKDWLAVASDNIENADLKFEPVCYPTAEAALEAMKRGEVDCVFPANLTDYDGEVRDVFITPPIMRTDMSAIVREADQKNFADKERVTVAVNVGNPNYDMFLLDHFPEWRPVHFDDTPACLQAVADGEADCLLISSYRYNNIANLCERLGLVTWSTGVEMDYCFAVNRNDQVLYSILSKAASVVPTSTVNAALAYYFTGDVKTSLADAISQALPFIVVGVATIGALAIVIVLVRGVWQDRKGARSRQKVPTAEDFALFDDLPFSYSVYRVTHVEHSKMYDAEFVYVNTAFARLGGFPPEKIVGRHVRELYPYIGEDWFENAKRAALDGETVEIDYTDPLSGSAYQTTYRQVITPGYCAVTYQ